MLGEQEAEEQEAWEEAAVLGEQEAEEVEEQVGEDEVVVIVGEGDKTELVAIRCIVWKALSLPAGRLPIAHVAIGVKAQPARAGQGQCLYVGRP